MEATVRPQAAPGCPWYVAAVMGTHFALGATAAFFAAGLAFSLASDLLARGELYSGGLIATSIVAAAACGVVAFIFLLSGQYIRRRTRRRYSVFCGALLCFGGLLAPIGLLTIYALTRPRAVEYYDIVDEERGFPVVPARPADSQP